MSAPIGIQAAEVGSTTRLGTTLAQMKLLLEQGERRVRRTFLLAVRDAQLVVRLEELERLLAAGRLDEAIAGMDVVAQRLQQAITTAYGAAGANAAAQLARALQLPVALDFDLLNERSVAQLRASQLRLVQGLREEARQLAQAVLSTGLEQGLAPRVIARQMRANLGLTAQQWGYVSNYRRQLEAGSRAALNRVLRDRRFDQSVVAVARGTRGPLTARQIDRMVDRYAARWVAHRANTVALTEALTAVNAGDYEMHLQAVERGLLTPDQVMGTWRTVGDSKVRDSHDPMQGQKRPLGVPFTSGSGRHLLYPGDPSAPASEIVHCRCVVVRKITGPIARG